ncbi:MAG: hypothetical protein HQP61_11715, partial [Peptococcaceae bacterium]|nr:hypothetical protein [Candidatus Syntrophopropionicum ammoniitolerans]
LPGGHITGKGRNFIVAPDFRLFGCRHIGGHHLRQGIGNHLPVRGYHHLERGIATRSILISTVLAPASLEASDQGLGLIPLL